MSTTLVCGKCDSKETDYGFEFYKSTMGNPCNLALCVFCRQTERMCPICLQDLKSHGLKTQFAYNYEQNLQEEKRNLEKQIDSRNRIESKYSRAKQEMSQLNQQDYHKLLELLEDAIQARFEDDERRLADMCRQIERLWEKSKIYRQQLMEQEVPLNRPPPQQLTSQINATSAQRTQTPIQSIHQLSDKDKDYQLRKFLRFF